MDHFISMGVENDYRHPMVLDWFIIRFENKYYQCAPFLLGGGVSHYGSPTKWSFCTRGAALGLPHVLVHRRFPNPTITLWDGGNSCGFPGMNYIYQRIFAPVGVWYGTREWVVGGHTQ